MLKFNYNYIKEVFGVCSSISHPLELANIDEYYISSFHTGYCFVSIILLIPDYLV